MIDGYKESPLGIIPKTWETKSLGELLEVNTGAKNAQDSIIDGKYPFFTRSVTTQKIDSYSYDTEALFIAGEGIFKVKHYSGKFDVHQRTYILTAKDKSNCSLKFFQNQIQSRIIKLVDTSVGSTVQSLRKPIIQELKLVIPPLPEQQKIAEILRTVDDKIEVIDQQIMETRELKKGLMQRLLTKGIGHTEFKDSPLGMIPKSWEVVQIGDVLKLGSGKDYKHLSIGEIPVYGTGGVMTYVDNYLHDGESVGIGRKGTIDKPVFLKGKFWTVDTLFYTHSFEKTTPFYIYIVFQSIKWRGYSEATGVPSLSKNIIEPIKIPLPPIEEQNKISNVFSSIDEKLEVLKEKKTHYQELKQGLMQQLLTGKVRVKV